MEPELSISYSSSTGDGLLGVGWTLGGLSVIDRTGANITQDGFKGGVNYDLNDRFQLDGQRLIAVNGVEGQDGAVYRTEKETWQKVVARYSDDAGKPCGSGPCWFSLTTKEGNHYEFGRTPDSRVKAFGGKGDVRTWAINRMEDLNGNYLTLSYTPIPYQGATDEGQYYPKTISYTANNKGGLQSQRSVELTYSQRPDVSRNFIGGFPVTTRARLTQVSSKVGNMEGPRYSLAYQTAPTTGRSRLIEIKQCAGAGSPCLPATNLAWQEMNASFTDSGSWLDNDFVTGWDIASNPRMLADVNGDGLLDIVGFRLDTQVSLAQQNSKFSRSSRWNPGFGSGWTAETPRAVADVNGDGLGDVVGFNFTGVETAPSSGSAFDRSLWSPAPYPYFGRDPAAGGWVGSTDPRMLVDVDGDGLSDIVGFKDKTYVALSRRQYFEPPAVWNASDFTGQPWLGKQRLRLLGDVNGDGLADVVGFGNAGVVVGISKGRLGGGFDLASWSQNSQGFPYFNYDNGWRADLHPRILADVNGDGLMDIVGFKQGVQVALSTGKGFLTPVKWNDGFSLESLPGWRADYPRMLIDVNADGQADVVGFDQLGAKVALSTGFDFQAGNWNENSLPDYRGGQSKKLLTVGDVNGDGKDDVVAFGTKINYPSSISVGLVSQKYPDLLTEIVNGLGGKVSVTYAPLTDPNVYQKNSAPRLLEEVDDSPDPNGLAFFTEPMAFSYSDVAAVYPIKQVVGGHIYVASEVVETTVPGIQASSYTYTNSYSYSGAKVDNLSQRWLGFQTMTDVSREDGRKTTTVFNQVYPLDGTVVRQEVMCAGTGPDPRCKPNAVMRVEINTYESKVTAIGAGDLHPKVYDIRRTFEREDHYTYGRQDFSIATGYKHNDYGEVLLESYLGYVDSNGNDLSPDDNVYTCTDYINLDPEGDWKLGYPRHTKQSRVAACENFSSFDRTNDLTLMSQTYDESGGTMNLLTEGRWDDVSSKYLTYTYEYDGFGNRIASTDPQGNKTTRTYETTFRTFIASQTSPPLSREGNRTLTESYAYDARFGLQTASVDPNGNVDIACIDDFGRPALIQVSSPGGAVIPDQNCLASGTGSSATVVTVSAINWLSDGKGGIYRETLDLQNWNTGGGREELYTREYLDGRGRTYRQVAQDNPANGDINVCQDFNKYDSPTRQDVPFFGASGSDCKAAALSTTFDYDVLNREIKMTRPNGPTGQQVAVTTTEYSDGDTVVRTFAATTSYPYKAVISYKLHDNEAKVVEVVVPADANATTRITYDRLGRITGTTDPKSASNPDGVSDSFAYDSLSRMIQAVTKDSGPSTFNFGGTEWLQTVANNYGQQRFEYDELGRTVVRTLADGSAHQFGYDDTNLTNGLGHKTMARVVDKSGAALSRTTYGYDKQGNNSSTALTLNNATYTTLREYDPQDRVRTQTYPDRSVLVRAYAYNNLSSLDLDGVKYAAFSQYSVYGKPGRISYPQTGVVEDIGYYPTSEFNTHVLKNNQNSKYLDRAVTWNDLSQVSAITDNLKSGGVDLSESFKYVDMRLTEAQGPYPRQTYRYDASGNLTGRNDIDYTYQGHRIKTGTRAGVAVFNADYDGMGSMNAKLSDGKNWRYEYDKLAQLTSVSLDGSATPQSTFTYDTDGHRLTKADSAGSVTTYVNEDYEVVTVNGVVSQTVKYLNDDSGCVATVTTASARAGSGGYLPAGVLYIHRNHLNSTVMTTDGAGNIASSFIYYPYGAIYQRGGPNNVRPKFTGKELDADSGLYYYEARYYDPDIARFITADDQQGASLTRQDSLNRYAYVLNSPASMTDPSGHGIGAVIAAIAKAAVDVIVGSAVRTGVTTVVRTAVTNVTRTTATSASRAGITNASRTAITNGSEAALTNGSRTAIVNSRALATTTRSRNILNLFKDPKTGRFVAHQQYRNMKAFYLRKRGRQFVTRYRGVVNQADIEGLEKGILVSPRMRYGGLPGAPRNRFIRALWRQWHSIASDPPPSPFVSITRKEHIAQMFAQKVGKGRVYQFRIRRRDEGFTWNYFFEAESLPAGGTRVRNVVQKPLDPTMIFKE
jgi:RHS repeat-associated protein